MMVFLLVVSTAGCWAYLLVAVKVGPKVVDSVAHTAVGSELSLVA